MTDAGLKGIVRHNSLPTIAVGAERSGKPSRYDKTTPPVVDATILDEDTFTAAVSSAFGFTAFVGDEA